MSDVRNIGVKLTLSAEEISAKFKKLETQISGVQKELVKTKQTLGGVSKETKQMGSSLEKSSTQASNFKKAFNFAALIVSLRKLASVFRRGLDEMSSYVENYNLYLVSMKEYQSEALRFQNKLNTSWGTNISQTMRYQGFFMNLVSSLGIAEDFAYRMSESLTLMTYDMASLFNWTTDVAYQRLQAGIVGQTKPLRYAGVDVTQQTIQPKLQELGIDKQVIELTQAEKVLLRYISILDQTKNAQGDYARTVDSTANQLKIMTALTSEAYRWFGALFIGVITKALPYWNAFLMVVKEVFKYIATLLGVSASDFDFFTGNVSSDIELIGEEIEGVEDKVKKLRGSLRKFDEINNISEPSSGTSDIGGMGSLSSTAILKNELDKMMKDYEESMLKVNYSANAIRDRWMEILGFTKYVNEETGEVYFKWEKLTLPLIGVIGLITTIGAMIVGLALKPIVWAFGISGVEKGVATISTLLLEATKTIGTSFNGILGFFGNVTGSIISATILTVVAVVLSIMALYQSFKENIFGVRDVWLEVWEKIKQTFSSVMDILTPLFMFLGSLIQDIWIKGLKPLWVSFKEMFASITKVVGEVVRDVFMPLLKFFIDILLPPLTVAIGVIGLLVGEVIIFVSNLLQMFFEAITNIMGHVSNFIEFIKPAFKPVVDGLAGIASFVKDIFTGQWSEAWNQVSAIFNKVWQGIKNAFSNVWDWIMNKFNKGGSIFDGIVDGISNIFKSLVNGLIDGINAIIRTPFNVVNGLMNKIRSFSILGAEPFKSLWGYNPLPVPRIPKLEDGGMVDAGQMFIAREAGAELVGQMGNKTAVMNNDQIVASVSKGVAQAVSGVMSGRENQPTTIILKMNDLELGRATIKSINKAQQTLGLSLQGV